MSELNYKNALIVGVGSGLSASLARLFAKSGMKVTVAARRLENLAALAQEVGGKAFTCDATDREQVAKLFADVEAAGGAPDVVVYNASYRTRGPFVDLDSVEMVESDFQEMGPVVIKGDRILALSDSCKGIHNAEFKVP